MGILDGSLAAFLDTIMPQLQRDPSLLSDFQLPVGQMQSANDVIRDCLALLETDDLSGDLTAGPAASGWEQQPLKPTMSTDAAMALAPQCQCEPLQCGSLGGSVANSRGEETQTNADEAIICGNEAESDANNKHTTPAAANNCSLLPDDLSFDAFDCDPENLDCATVYKTPGVEDSDEVDVVRRMVHHHPCWNGGSAGWPPAPPIWSSQSSESMASFMLIDDAVVDTSHQTAAIGSPALTTLSSEDTNSSFGSLCHKDITEDDISQSSLENRLREGTIFAQQNSLLDSLKQTFGSSQRLLSDAVAFLNNFPAGHNSVENAVYYQHIQDLLLSHQSESKSSTDSLHHLSSKNSSDSGEDQSDQNARRHQLTINEANNSKSRRRKTATVLKPKGSVSTKKKVQPGTSKFRGVSRHRLTKRWEASLWVNKKQMYLGGYNDELSAARAYDLAALFCKGPGTATNLPSEQYTEELQNLSGFTKETLVAHLRRNSCAFSRGKSRYRGVSGHHGRWEARIGHFDGRKNVSFGVHDSEEEAARQYDRALIIEKGERAKTNFPLTDYVQEVEAYESFLIQRFGNSDIAASAEILQTSWRCILPFKGELSDIASHNAAAEDCEDPDSVKRAQAGTSKSMVIYAEQLRRAMSRTKLVAPFTDI